MKEPLPPDIPSPIDLRAMQDALDWERNAMLRPFRSSFFRACSQALGSPGTKHGHVLELGSGPGFLAEHLLTDYPDLQMTLYDFSPAMHELALKRLAPFLHRVSFITGDFSKAGWELILGRFDAVLTLQAVHELRHKRHAPVFHACVKSLLKPGAPYLVCDHYCGKGGMQNEALFMTPDEQRLALECAGYKSSKLLMLGGRVLFRAHIIA